MSVAIWACSSSPPSQTPLVASGPAVPCVDAPLEGEVCIAGGQFVMGHDPVAPVAQAPCVDAPSPGNDCGPSPLPYDYAAPAHLVDLSPFFINRLPAKNSDYLACFEAGECAADGVVGGSISVGNDMPPYRFDDPNLADYPVAFLLRRAQAEAFCRFYDKRLPTEAEWERAARGAASFDYPWGNTTPDCSRRYCGTLATAPPIGPFFPVGQNPGDVSPEGVREMVTNVTEVVHDDFRYYPRELGPVVDPQGPDLTNTTDVTPAIRGAILIRPEQYQVHGVSSPPPAWWRDVNMPFGVRCARSDKGGMPDLREIHPDCATASCLAIHQAYPRAIAVDSGNVYWLDRGGNNSYGQVMKAPLAGGSPTMLTAGDVGGAITVDGVAVYFDGDDGVLRRVPISGGTWEQVADHFCGFTVDDSQVYVGGQSLLSIPKAGGAGTTVLDAPAGQQICVAAANGASVYYWLTGPAPSRTATLMQVAKAGGVPTMLATGVMGEVVVDAANIYWLAQLPAPDQPTIFRLPVSGGTPMALVSSKAAFAFAVDGAAVYFTDLDPGTVNKFLLPDGPTTVVASGRHAPHRVAVDATSVYWTDAGRPDFSEGAVLRANK